MAVKINLPLKGWKIESEVVNEDGFEVTSYYATKGKSSIEIYAGPTPEGSDAKNECMLSYAEAFGCKEGDEIPLGELPFLGGDAYFYDAEDDSGAPVIVVCVEPDPGIMVMAILGDKDDDSIDDLLSLVDQFLILE